MTDQKIYDCIVIGSGPAATFFLKGFLDKTKNVLVIDGGREIEDDVQKKINNLKNLKRDEFNQQLLEHSRITHKGVDKKDYWGSVFSHVQAHPTFKLTVQDGAFGYPSYALGGFSRSWGASVLPFLSADIEDWPIKYEELLPYYLKVKNEFQMLGESDDITDLYGQAAVTELSVGLVPLAKNIVERAKKIVKRDFILGTSRLAFEKTGNCTECLACLKGCPVEKIFSSKNLFKKLQSNFQFEYKNKIYVEKYESSADGVTVYTRGENGQAVSFFAKKLVLGAGVFGSGMIVLNSMYPKYQELEIKDSQYMIFPTWNLNSFKSEIPVKGISLNQLNIEIVDKKITPNAIHLQLYFYNSMYLALFKKYFKFDGIAKFLASHFVVVQGFIHSKFSDGLKLKINSPGTFVASATVNDKAKKYFAEVRPRIFDSVLKLKLLTLPQMIKRNFPGKSFHLGGSMPMSKNPKGLETDSTGLLACSPHVFVVDASVFPSIPASTITYTVMANAMRIGESLRDLT